MDGVEIGAASIRVTVGKKAKLLRCKIRVFQRTPKAQGVE